MNAMELKNLSMKVQFESVVKTIKAASANGWKGTYVEAGKGALYPEVIERLKNEYNGIDIIIQKNAYNDTDSTNYVSWEDSSNSMELKKLSIERQFKSVAKTIMRASVDGRKGTYVEAGKGTLYPEVVEMIKKEYPGIKITTRINIDNDFYSTNYVSWE